MNSEDPITELNNLISKALTEQSTYLGDMTLVIPALEQVMNKQHINNVPEQTKRILWVFWDGQYNDDTNPQKTAQVCTMMSKMLNHWFLVSYWTNNRLHVTKLYVISLCYKNFSS